MGDKKRRFDPEFRAGAVRLVKETGKPVAQVARDLGISPYTLQNWVRIDREQVQGEELGESERQELARLRAEQAAWAKERAEFGVERDVHKRSVALLAKGSMGPVIVADVITIVCVGPGFCK